MFTFTPNKSITDPNVGGLGEERLRFRQNEFSDGLVVDEFLDRAEHVDGGFL